MSNKNEVFEYLIDQLRQQVNNNQCEDLAHEVQSLKNQLCDASEQIKELHKDLARATGDVEAYKLVRKGGYGPEQSGCRKEDVQGCEHSWIIMPGLFLSEGNPNNVPGSELCSKCGKREWDDGEYKPKNDTSECEHDWYFYDTSASMMCKKCGMKR
ncbi:hypothetical protein [Salmonella phage vB_SenS_Psm140]